MRFAITFLLLSALPIFARAKEKTIITCQVNEVGLTLGGNSGEQKGPLILDLSMLSLGIPKNRLRLKTKVCLTVWIIIYNPTKMSLKQ